MNYSDDLNNIAVTLRDDVNGLQTAGNDKTGAQGAEFFTGTGAGDLTVALTKPGEVAASGTGMGIADGSNADLLGKLADSTTGADYNYRQMVVKLGVEAQTVNRRSDIQGTITTQVDAARDAQAGVSLDEEMSNMLQYQRAYQAASKVLSVNDDTLNTLINCIGIGS